MLRPFLYAFSLVVILVVGGFAYIAFAPLPVDAKPVIKDIAIGDVIKEAPAPIKAAIPAAQPSNVEETAQQPSSTVP